MSSGPEGGDSPHEMLSYLRHGWRLTFARSRQKNPGSLMGANWQDKLAGKPEDAEHWLAIDPQANVGIQLGPASGIVDVEYDTDEGREIVERMVAADPQPTPTYISGKSIHRLYRWDESLPKATVPRYQGIEFRINSDNRGLQSIVPPSIHPSGKRYEWLPGLSPDEVAVRPMPFALWDLCWFAANQQEQTEQTKVDSQGQLYVAAGNRHNWMRDRLFSLAHWGLSQHQLMQIAQVLESEVAHFDDDGSRDFRLKKLVDGAIEKRVVTEAQLDVSAPAYQTLATTADQLIRKQIRRDFVVRNLMVLGEPMIIGGASKSLKTSVMLDLAVSIATGKPFLNEFEVPQRRPVMVISGESGELTIQEFLKCVIRTRGLAPEDLSTLYLSHRLPKLDDPRHVDDLITELKQNGIEIVFIDPLYRSLRAGDQASNVYAMGEKLELIAERIHTAGITPILLHHFRKQGRSYGDAPELEDLSQAGIAEFGRQFLLLKRREKYQYDGNHSLWFQWGGSAGHQGIRILDADTGTYEEGLHWQTELHKVDNWKPQQSTARATASRTSDDSRKQQILTTVRRQPGIGKEDLRTQVTGRRCDIYRLLDELVQSGQLQLRKGSRGRCEYTLGESDRSFWLSRK